MSPRFRDRRDAGRRLAWELARLTDEHPIVLALPRGGVPVAFEVARALRAPLDVLVVRKLGAPGQEELAMGAVASGGATVINRNVLDTLGISREAVAETALREGAEVARRDAVYRGELPMLDVAGRTVVLVDDGLATGASMKAAIQALRQYGPARIVAAVPIAPESTCRVLADVADEVVCAETPEHFGAVGLWYDDFAQTSDAEVIELLAQHRASSPERDARRRHAG